MNQHSWLLFTSTLLFGAVACSENEPNSGTTGDGSAEQTDDSTSVVDSGAPAADSGATQGSTETDSGAPMQDAGVADASMETPPDQSPLQMDAGGDSSCSVDTAELIPAEIEGDLEVGPGCLTVASTRMADGATLTIAAGSTVLMQPDAILSTGTRGTNDSTGSLVALGTADEPIVFTSAASEPAPGDWQCVLLSSSSAGSRLDHVVLEYGGAECGNAHDEGLLVVSGAARVTNATIRYSSSHGAFVDPFNDAPRAFDSITFSDNALASVLVGSTKVTDLGADLTFENADDVIEVDGTYSGMSAGTWRKQAVPYVLLNNVALANTAEVEVEPGVEIQIRSGRRIDASTGALRLVGTAEAPILVTSAEAVPEAGDWSCLMLGAGSRIENAIVEYAGAGSGCTGADYKTAVRTTSAIKIANATFREIDGAAVVSSVDCDDTSTSTEWCANTLENVSGMPAFTCSTNDEFCP